MSRPHEPGARGPFHDRRRRRRASSMRRQPFQPDFHGLERRMMPATFLVTTTADSGAGSLRQAILDADAAPAGPLTIDFQIPTSDPNFVDDDAALSGGDAAPDVFVISPLSALPALNNPNAGIAIDGGSQTAFTGDTNPFGPEVVLDG